MPTTASRVGSAALITRVVSVLPADLLREATDLDLADLYAYLKRLR